MNEIELLDLARSIDPNTEIVLPSEENPKVNCDLYGDGCEYGLTIRFKNLIIIVVKFVSIQAAQQAAFEFDAYTRANWVFDYVKGEPLLENIFIKDFKAIKIERPNYIRMPYESLKDKKKKETTDKKS